MKIVFTSAKYLNITPWNCELKENSHLRFETYKNLITNQTTVREAFIFISTKNQIWDAFFSFCLLLLISLSSNYLFFFFKIWGPSLVANQSPSLFRHKALSTMLSQIQSSISSSQGMVFCRCSHSSQWFNAGLFSWNGVQGSNWDSSVIFLLCLLI